MNKGISGSKRAGGQSNAVSKQNKRANTIQDDSNDRDKETLSNANDSESPLNQANATDNGVLFLGQESQQSFSQSAPGEEQFGDSGEEEEKEEESVNQNDPATVGAMKKKMLEMELTIAFLKKQVPENSGGELYYAFSSNELTRLRMCIREKLFRRYKYVNQACIAAGKVQVYLLECMGLPKRGSLAESMAANMKSHIMTTLSQHRHNLVVALASLFHKGMSCLKFVVMHCFLLF